jgi:hypothetical protein
MKIKFLLLSFLLLGLAGCVDGRIKQAASLSNVKAQVTAKEYKAAKTPEEKLKIAEEYFNTAPRLTQVVEDYLYGRNVPAAPVKSEVKTTSP